MVGSNNYILPVDYVLEKFYHYAGKPKKVGTKYNASCPICREGKNWLKKKRLYYYPSSNSLYCHNCQGSWSALWWVKEVSGMDPKTIINEAKKQYGAEEGDGFFRKIAKEEMPWVLPDLPVDSINLFDAQEMDFYRSNKKVQAALQYVKDRRLDVSINKPKAIYFSLKDRTHKHRIIFPFYDEDGRKVLFYQTRQLFKDSESAKYISKFNAEKTICGINNIRPEIPFVFIFEGPIDSFFVRNSVAMAGIQYTSRQQQQLQSLDGFYQKIWVLDNPAQDQNEEVKDKILELIDRDETVFIWPKEFAKYKDINELCVDKQINEIPYQLLVKFAKKGNEAKMAMIMSN
jgi:hypothetical protein